MKRRRLARECLEDALAAFDLLGARTWAARTREELGHIGGRPPASQELTPTEREIAELVAMGWKSQEVASSLFIAVKTVESNLTRIYRKLGVESRSQMAAKLAEEKVTSPGE
jgi:DNA-binding NarL/FixJ family response regulator